MLKNSIKGNFSVLFCIFVRKNQKKYIYGLQ